MHNLTIRQSLTLLVLVPLACVAVGIVQLYSYATDRITTARLTEKMIGMGEATASLVHQLQIERGASVVMVAASDNRAAHESRVVAAREASDKAFAPFQHMLDQVASDSEMPQRAYAFVNVGSRISRDVTEFREKVSKGAVKAPDVLNFYNNTITALVHGAVGSSVDSPFEDIAILRAGLQSLMVGKEFAGQQRATGNAIVNAETVNHELVERFLRISALQAEHLGQMRRHLGEKVGPFFDAFVPQELTQRLQQTERALLESLRNILPGPSAGPIGGISPPRASKPCARLKSGFPNGCANSAPRMD
jgi:hypothetical protein